MNITGKYLKVWKVKEQNGYTKLDLGDSQKRKDGTYDNCTWFDCTLFSDAAKKTVHEGDTIEITSGLIFQEKYNDKWYIRVKIFHMNVTPAEQRPEYEPPKYQGYTPPPSNPTPELFKEPEPFEDDIPF